MKYLLYFFIIFSSVAVAQDTDNNEQIRLQLLEQLINNKAGAIKGFNETAKLDLKTSDVFTLLSAVATAHEINMVIATPLNSLRINNTFEKVKVSDLLFFLAKEYQLDYTFVGQIMNVEKYIPPIQIVKENRGDINYDLTTGLISLDLNNVSLDKAFKYITDETGKNLLFDKAIQKQPLSIYLKDAPLTEALQQLAIGNDLLFEQSKEGFYLFSTSNQDAGKRSFGSQSRQLDYEILDTLRQQVRVNFKNVPIEEVVLALSKDLRLGVFMASPLTEAGTVTVKVKSISFEELLDKIFKSQETSEVTAASVQSSNRGSQPAGNSSQRFTYKREGNLFFFGTDNQLTLKVVEVIPLRYRSIQMADSQGLNNNNNINNSFQDPNQFISGGRSGNNANFNNTNGGNQRGGSNQFNSQQNNNGSQGTSIAETIQDLLPDDVTDKIKIKIDTELNSFIVSGPADKVEDFKKLIVAIDKPVPVILIETMIIEINKNNNVSTGLEWGLGDAPTQDQGSIYPGINLQLGANTVNRVIGGINGISSLNLGSVLPNFYVRLNALEQNGDISIKSSPKLSVLNGHEAQLSIGETTYYIITARDIIGTNNPQTSTVQSFQPISAELGIYIKPTVSSSGDITMGISVNQSTFSSTRITEGAPPDIISRSFSSTIRVKDKDVIVLGGLDKNMKSDSGSGVPFLARIPFIKYLFSKRVRNRSTEKLAILIRPTVIY
jgi:type II secretory pathway component GspD/PulD (secretin)